MSRGRTSRGAAGATLRRGSAGAPVDATQVVPGGAFTPAELTAYAQQLVAQLQIQPGQTVALQCSTHDRATALAIAQEAYKAGAGDVDIQWDDPDLRELHDATGGGGLDAAVSTLREQTLAQQGARTLSVDDAQIGRALGITEERVRAPWVGPATPWSAQELQRYAETMVHAAVAVKEGDTVSINATPDNAHLAVELAKRAFAAGARDVSILYEDPALDAVRAEFAQAMETQRRPHLEARDRELTRRGASFVKILDTDSVENMAGLDPKRVADMLDTKALYDDASYDASNNMDLRWAEVMAPSPGWASRVYPEIDDPDEALRALGEDLLYFARCGPNDPPGAWEAHVRDMHAQAAAVNDLDIVGIDFDGPDTQLSVGLHQGAAFMPVQFTTNSGETFMCNFPSEEVFSTPDWRQVSGSFAISHDWFVHGQQVRNVRGRFEAGQLVDVSCEPVELQDWVRAQLMNDVRSGRLGEVALLDSFSRTAQKGRVYQVTHVDEQLAPHVAVGTAYRAPLAPDAEVGEGFNGDAPAHYDWMLGNADVYGRRADGTRVPLILNGAWQVGPFADRARAAMASSHP